MSKSSKLILFVVGGLVGLLVVVVTIVALVLRVNVKPRLTAAASQALGMEFSAGRLDIRFLPSLHIAVADAHIRNRGAEVASVQEADLRIELLPLLLHKDVRIGKLALKRLSVSIERDRGGKLNIARQAQAKGARQRHAT